jgi:hypothetical protein
MVIEEIIKRRVVQLWLSGEARDKSLLIIT